METVDCITIFISTIAIFLSSLSLIIAFLNYRRGTTKLKINQLYFASNPLATKVIPNKLFLDREQSKELREIVPILYLIVYLKIDNLSYTDITISELIINDKFLVTKINNRTMKEKLSLCFFSSKDCFNRDLNANGSAVPLSMQTLKSDDYDIINVGHRIASKSTVEGIIVISGNKELYKAVNDGKNKLTILTTDKKINVNIEVDKTVIP